MKIVHITAGDSGGAGLAAFRLNEALVKSGVDSVLLCKRKSSTSKNVVEYKPSIWNKIFAQIILKLKSYSITRPLFTNLFPFVHCSQSLYDLSKHPLVQQADIINLHWLGGTVNYKKLFRKIKKPIVWTLHDMNPFMGNEYFMTDIHAIKDKKLLEKEHRLQKIKEKIIRGHGNITVVNLCEWMKNYSSSSGTFHDSRHVIIRNSLETDIFKPYDRYTVRKLLGLPENANIFMFGCQYLKDVRKGVDILLDAIKLRNNPDDVYIVCGEQQITIDNLNIIQFGKIKDERFMALLYSAADAFLLPSREDNLPNTMLESLCCGTPVISFSNGGMTDIIEDGHNGYIVNTIDAEHFASAIEKFSINKSHFNQIEISDKARLMFAPEAQAADYVSLYKSILASGKQI